MCSANGEIGRIIRLFPPIDIHGACLRNVRSEMPSSLARSSGFHWFVRAVVRISFVPFR
jgi:hypothetical protein